MLKSFRYLLFPFAFLYGLIIRLRNWMFDKNILKSSQFNFPIICVGNLAVGGTGKTPMVEYLVDVLKDRFRVATLSRGYKRKTKGFAIADTNTTAIDIGDEPMQFHLKYPAITVAVGEERLVAIPQILQAKPETEVIILDDAFQHRTVRAGLNILLTEYRNLYTRDLMMPAGDLRDNKISSKRADIIVVTKCPPALDESEKNQVKEELGLLTHQQVFFTAIDYGKPYQLLNRQEISIGSSASVLLVCGIANPKPMMEYLTNNTRTYDMLRFPDHHIFKIDDLEEIKSQFSKLQESGSIILTTEKDAVRLEKFKDELARFPFYVLPIRHRFLFNESEKFNDLVVNSIKSYQTKQ